MKNNGKKKDRSPAPAQTSLDLDRQGSEEGHEKERLMNEPAGGEAANNKSPAPQSGEEQVAELHNTKEGCWKVLEDGRRVNLSQSEWREELARIFSGNPITDKSEPDPTE